MNQVKGPGSILFFLLLIWSVPACKKDIPEPPTKAVYFVSTGSYSKYDVSFYSNSNVGVIQIALNGETRTLNWYMNFIPVCNESGTASFSIPPGTYSYSAHAALGRTWNGTIITNGNSSCILIGLN